MEKVKSVMAKEEMVEFKCILTHLELALKMEEAANRAFSEKDIEEFESDLFRLSMFLGDLADQIRSTYCIKQMGPNSFLNTVKQEFSGAKEILEQSEDESNFKKLAFFFDTEDEKESKIERLIRMLNEMISLSGKDCAKIAH